MQIIENSTVYDAIIVGSGAGGGMAAKVLSESGLKVAVVEAGPFYDPAMPEHQTQLKWPYESPRRGKSTKFRPFGDFDAAYGGWDIEGEPYTQKMGPSLNGSDRGCWVGVPTTGEGFHSALDQRTLSIKMRTATATTGLSVMMM